ncbi:MAG: CBS domain-containing protein [Burkholderiales bacterium]|nr:CBS domain-containing protein [Burkholderiales bacterium]
MIVRNWMQPNPKTIPGDMLVSEAKRVLSENNLHALPVVDEGSLRGLVTRANLLRMGQFVLRTQNPDEFNFFVTRLKVRDIMVRNPATVAADDTMEQCLLRGQELGVAQFPVVEGRQVVGVISANEIFQLAAHCLGAWEKRSGVTLAPLELGPGVLGRIADAVEGAGAVLQALYPIGWHEDQADGGYLKKRVIIRFHANDVREVVTALQAAGYPVIESVQAHKPALAA